MDSLINTPFPIKERGFVFSVIQMIIILWRIGS
jgi:hypothetical protein